ncbi:8590_t:CDS:2 [Diversispora eburnea]|uniref:8590_t:CDS:1 n=1 Tax=Diversispora eburnea TaxID=1213867 RepID=A0A9N8YI05_9GLOM|nr:8590_t:CDS:2 [Diversispora eburnea]
MPQIKQQARHIKNPSTGQAINTADIIHANLDVREERLKVSVMLIDGSIIDFPVPTSKEIRDRFFYKKAKSSDRPARPPNKFFIFRTMFQDAVDTYKLQVPIVSGIASEVWKKSSPEVKDVFTKLSQIAKIEHSELNPGYVYKPYRKISKDLNQKELKELKVKEINSMNSTHSLDSTQNFIIATSPCPSSSNYSSLPVTPNNYSSLPVTPTQPLWPITSQHTLPKKNHENYNLSSQNMQPNINSYPEITPSLLKSITILPISNFHKFILFYQ